MNFIFDEDLQNFSKDYLVNYIKNLHSEYRKLDRQYEAFLDKIYPDRHDI